MPSMIEQMSRFCPGRRPPNKVALQIGEVRGCIRLDGYVGSDDSSMYLRTTCLRSRVKRNMQRRHFIHLPTGYDHDARCARCRNLDVVTGET